MQKQDTCQNLYSRSTYLLKLCLVPPGARSTSFLGWAAEMKISAAPSLLPNLAPGLRISPALIFKCRNTSDFSLLSKKCNSCRNVRYEMLSHQPSSSP